MEQNLIYIIGFIILTFVALIVSFSLKYEKRDYGGEDHHGHEYDHEHSESLPGFEKLRGTVANLSGDIKILQERALTSPITIEQLNNRFAYRKAADYSSASELTFNGDSFSGGPTQGDPIVLYENSKKFLALRGIVYVNSVGFESSENSNYKSKKVALIVPRWQKGPHPYFVLSNNNDVDSYSISYSGNTINYNSQNPEDIPYKLFAVDEQKSAVYNIIPENNPSYKVINRIEYFGLTTGNNLPTPYYNNYILNTNASRDYINNNSFTTSTLETVPQVIPHTSNITIEGMRLGLFAKVAINEPNPADPTDFTGFTANTTNYKIIEYENYSNETPITVNDAIYEGLTTDGAPHYLIYLVPIKNGVPSKITCVSGVKNVQVVVLLTGEVDENYVDTPTVLDRSSLTDVDPINYTKNQYYYIQGKDNIISMVFFKFNHTGTQSSYVVDIQYWNTPPFVSHVEEEHVYVFNYYNSFKIIQPESYLNYYHYDNTTGDYTWKVRKNGAWVDQDNLE